MSHCKQILGPWVYIKVGIGVIISTDKKYIFQRKFRSKDSWICRLTSVKFITKKESYWEISVI